MVGKKLKIGWFSFTCSEDSTMVFIELMNEHLDEWRRLIEFRHARVLKKDNHLNDIDVAFVEGAITNEKDADMLRQIRQNSRKLIAIGSCAVSGMPAAQRNSFDPEMNGEIQFLIKRFKQSDKVRAIKEVVKVDGDVPGCPMEEAVFLSTLHDCMKEFGVVDA